jgi:hypothetical protein
MSLIQVLYDQNLFKDKVALFHFTRYDKYVTFIILNPTMFLCEMSVIFVVSPNIDTRALYSPESVENWLIKRNYSMQTHRLINPCKIDERPINPCQIDER